MGTIQQKKLLSQTEPDFDSNELETIVANAIESKDPVKLTKALKSQFPDLTTKELYDSLLDLRMFFKVDEELLKAVKNLKPEDLA